MSKSLFSRFNEYTLPTVNKDTFLQKVTLSGEQAIHEIDTVYNDYGCEFVGYVYSPEELNKERWCDLYQVAKTKEGGTVFIGRINDTISQLNEYIHLLEHLNNMCANDILILKISSPGGYISTGTQICSLIDTCKGTVITHACGMCASAGSLIWAAGDVVTIGNSALFMWHMSSHSDNGNTVMIEQEATVLKNYVRDVLLNVSLTKGFITQEEITEIYTKPNFARWITANEMRQRLAEYHKTMNTKTPLTNIDSTVEGANPHG